MFKIASYELNSVPNNTEDYFIINYFSVSFEKAESVQYKHRTKPLSRWLR